MQFVFFTRISTKHIITCIHKIGFSPAFCNDVMWYLREIYTELYVLRNKWFFKFSVLYISAQEHCFFKSLVSYPYDNPLIMVGRQKSFKDWMQKIFRSKNMKHQFFLFNTLYLKTSWCHIFCLIQIYIQNLYKFISVGPNTVPSSSLHTVLS